ncbi:MAG TPA: DUF6624 domain-containing protein [Chitinophagaceae bacterium]|jgi:hypothetical protein|nr:DUF6624 domain-containing protein [Chitinophagaceae bacterium]
MKCCLIAIFIAFSFTTASAQTYWALLYEASSLYEKKDYAGSLKIYKKTFKHYKSGYPSHFYDAACAAVLAGEKKQAFKLLQHAIGLGYSNAAHIESDKNWLTARESKEWSGLVARVRANVNVTPSFYDIPLREQLLTILKEDQAIRRQIGDTVKKYGFVPHPVTDSLIKYERYIDSLHLVSVINILKTHGYPSVRSVGTDVAFVVFLVIQHSDLGIQEQYHSLLKKAMEEGDLFPDNLALLEDRIALRQGRKQSYGSQIGTNLKTGEQYVQPLEDPDNVDLRRAALGLEPLSDYLRIYKLSWDPVTYKRKLEQGLIENQLFGK